MPFIHFDRGGNAVGLSGTFCQRQLCSMPVINFGESDKCKIGAKSTTRWTTMRNQKWRVESQELGDRYMSSTILICSIIDECDSVLTLPSLCMGKIMEQKSSAIPTFLSVCLSICLSVCPIVCLSVCLSSIYH